MSIVLDDLHWADDSSLELFGFIATCHVPGVCLIGMYRPDELGPRAHEQLSMVISHAEHIQLDGLEATAVHALGERSRQIGRYRDDRKRHLATQRRAPVLQRETGAAVGDLIAGRRPAWRGARRDRPPLAPIQ